MASEAFGGAKTVFVAKVSPLRKESVQIEQDDVGDIISPPQNDEYGDVREYCLGLQGVNSYHDLAVQTKKACTVGLGIDLLETDGSEEAVMDRLSEVNEYGQSFFDVAAQAGEDFFAGGAGALEVVRDRRGRAAELYYMRSQDVHFRPRGSRTPFYYMEEGILTPWARFKAGERDENSILYVPLLTNKSRLYGIPDWLGAIPDIELDYYAVRYNQRFFLNSGVPDLAIVVEGGELGEEGEKAVQEFLRSNFKGVDNAHRVLYLPIPGEDVTVKFEKLASQLKDQDMSFEKLRMQCRDNILSSHRIHPRVAGVVQSGQLGGSGEVYGQLQMFQETTVAPYQRLWEAKLRPVLADFGVKDFRLRSLDPNVTEKPSEALPKYVQAGILDAEEAREELGYARREEDPEERTEKGLIRSLEAFRKANTGEGGA